MNNFAFYTGKQANVVYRYVKHRGHGQTLDDAQWAWETLFKGAVIIADGEVLEVAQESVICLRDGFVESMYMPARNKDGLLYVNLRWFTAR